MKAVRKLLTQASYESLSLEDNQEPSKSELPQTTQDATKAYKHNRAKMRINQSVKYISPDGTEHNLRVKKLEGSRVLVGSNQTGILLVDITSFKLNPQHDTMWLAYSKGLPTKEVHSSEGDIMEETAADEHLKVLIDEAGQTLAKRLFKQFISDNDFKNFTNFTVGLDNLLAEFRGGQPVTLDEVDEFSDEIDKDVDKIEDEKLIDKKLKDQDEDDDEFSEHNASYNEVTANTIKHRLVAFMNNLHTSDPSVKELRNYAFQLGFRPNSDLSANYNAYKNVLSMQKKNERYIAVFSIKYNEDDDNYKMMVAHTRRGADDLNETIRPWKHTFSNVRELIKRGKEILDKYQ